MADAKKVKKLVLKLASKQPKQRLEAAKKLFKLGEIEWILYIKGDDDDFIRLAQSNNILVAEALGRSKDPKSLKALWNIVMDQSRKNYIRVAAVRAYKFKPNTKDTRVTLNHASDYGLVGSHVVRVAAQETKREMEKD